MNKIKLVANAFLGAVILAGCASKDVSKLPVLALDRLLYEIDTPFQQEVNSLNVDIGQLTNKLKTKGNSCEAVGNKKALSGETVGVIKCVKVYTEGKCYNTDTTFIGYEINTKLARKWVTDTESRCK